MVRGLIHIVLNTVFVVVFAVIATIVFVIAWPFWYIRRRRARERCPEIALEVLNQRSQPSAALAVAAGAD